MLSEWLLYWTAQPWPSANWKISCITYTAAFSKRDPSRLFKDLFIIPGEFSLQQTQKGKKFLLFGNSIVKCLLREILIGIFGAINGLLEG